MASIAGIGIIISLIGVVVISIPMGIVYLIARSKLHSHLNKVHGKKYNALHTFSTNKSVPKVPEGDVVGKKLKKNMIIAEIIMAAPFILLILFAILI